MNASEAIEEIKHLSREEQRKVVASIHQLESGEISEKYKRLANKLFRKLAQ